MCRASHSLKRPDAAYGQQRTLFWAIVPNIKKQSGGRLTGWTCNRSSETPPLARGTSDSSRQAAKLRLPTWCSVRADGGEKVEGFK